MKYFLHDTNAFQDEKVTELFIQFGYEGVGLFYTILEKLALQEKPVKTVVLKKQLSVGKKLEKVWSYLEEIELISSNNGETFNENILKFSEKYQVSKDKTKERVAKWRESQEVKKNVTRYNRVRNADNNTILNNTELKEKKRERVRAQTARTISFRLSKKRKRKAPFVPRVSPKKSAVPPPPPKPDPFYRNRNAESVNVPFSVWYAAYDYNVNSEQCKRLWVGLTDTERNLALSHSPMYVNAYPNKRFRKIPENYLIDKTFNDEIVPRHAVNTSPSKNAINGHINGQSNPFGQGAIIPPGASYRPQTFGRRNKSGVGDTESAGAGPIQ